METLNDYCLLHIFQGFSPKDRLNFSKVCKAWNVLMIRFWRVFKLSTSFYDISYVSSDTYLKKLDYICANDLNDIISNCGPFIKDVSLIPMLNESNDNIRVQFDHYVYRTRKFTINDMLDTLTNVCFNIESLKIYFSGDVKDYPTQLLHKLIESNASLRKLEISCGDIGFLNSIIELEKLPTNLAHLILTNVMYETDNSLCLFLEQATNLRQLKLIKVKPITDRSLHILSLYASQLRVLHLHEERVGHFKEMKSIAKLVNLEEFSVIGFTTSLTDSVITEISLSCKKIRELSLSECQRITGRGMNVLVSSLPQLQVLQLRYLNMMTISSGQTQSNLKTLKLHYCQSLSDEKLRDSIQSMPYLSYLQIINCFNLVRCERVICSIISIAVMRNRVFQVTESRGSNMKRQIMVYNPQHHERQLNGKGFDKESIFNMVCISNSPNLLRVIQNHTKRTLPVCHVSHETVTGRYL